MAVALCRRLVAVICGVGIRQEQVDDKVWPPRRLEVYVCGMSEHRVHCCIRPSQKLVCVQLIHLRARSGRLEPVERNLSLTEACETSGVSTVSERLISRHHVSFY